MNDKINEFYLATIYEILVGVDVVALDWVLKDFEEQELYEECAGMKKALDFCAKRTIDEIKEEYDTLIIKKYEDYD